MSVAFGYKGGPEPVVSTFCAICRLAVATCMVLGAALAKPSLPAGRDDGSIIPLGVEPITFQDIPDHVAFRKGEERSSHTLPSGSYILTSPKSLFE